jgi:hypothetical protein
MTDSGYRRLTKKTVHYGRGSREEWVRVKFAEGPDDPRNLLIESLAAAVGDDRAIDIMGALYTYLATDPTDRVPALQWCPPDHKVERDRAIKERDEAVARAEKAEQQLTKKKSPRSREKR